jgi:opacity protein-like surface antigen
MRDSMLKKVICLLSALPILISAARASDFLNKFSIKLTPAGIFAVDGNYNDTDKLKQVVNIGLGFGVTLRYEINENIYIDAGYVFNWMSIKGDKKPFAYKEESPAFNLQMFTLNTSFFLKSGYLIEPYLTLGCGIYPWKFSKDPIWGETWPALGNPDERFSNTSFGLNVGLGLESYIFSLFSISAEVKYHYVFSRDPAKFGTDDFTQQDFLAVSIGLTYNFKKK